MSGRAFHDPPEVWGGLECTFARIRRGWRDQVTETGHRQRPDDIEAVAALGIGTLRYPVLWESVSPVSPDVADFRWHDARLRRLQEAGIAPVLGLMHHGSGPRYTNLLDPDFPGLLERHAERVARRYPWVSRFTPVNEPLTTARFSALYGHWYPHRRNARDFARALLHQCQGIARAMTAIRRVIPQAELVQTEDLGKVFGTPLLQYQADYENERRWLTFDLLLGRVDRAHPWFELLVRYGIGEGDLLALCDAPCPPDILGINHYLTSERFLEHRRAHWPPGQRGGGGGRHRYADLEAVRVPLAPGATGPAARLREVSARYDRPLAVTEVHHGCSRDEQLRWLHEVWSAAKDLRREGHDIRAVTVWALFGTMDWNTLLTRRQGVYEPGAFDVRAPKPRLTALGRATRAIVASGDFDHPVLDTAGWWRRDERFYAPVAGRTPLPGARQSARRKLLLLGASGPLGIALARVARHRGLEHVALGHADLDPGDARAVRAALEACRPWAVIDAGKQVAKGGRQSGGRDAGTPHGVSVLAQACADAGLPLVGYSSHRVFSGPHPRPWVESDPVRPAGADAEGLAQAEEATIAAHPGALVIRTGACFGPWDSGNVVVQTLAKLAARRPVPADGALVSPLYLPDLAHATFDLLIDGERGLWHLANGGVVTALQFVRRIAELSGLDAALVEPVKSADLPPMAALRSERGEIVPSLESALARFFRDCEVAWRPSAEVGPRIGQRLAAT